MNSQDYSDSYARDRAEIEDLMARYLFALDYNDMDSFIAMFTDDAEFEFARGRVRGKANILETVKGFKVRIGEHYKDEDGNPAVLRHVLAHTAIRIEGDRAWTTGLWWEMTNGGPDVALKAESFGTYGDELARVDGRWLFKRRKIYNEFLQGRESGPEKPVLAMDAQ